MIPRLSVLAASLVLLVVSAHAQDGDKDKGRAFAEEKCARCHAVGMEGESTLPIAPPFRTLASKYPLESLEESLAEGIVTSHPQMPEFELDPDQIADLIAWLDAIAE